MQSFFVFGGGGTKAKFKSKLKNHVKNNVLNITFG